MSKVAKATIGLMFITIISKILGFFKEMVLVSSYGASMITDSYITAMNIPIAIFSTIGVALATTFIPLFYEVSNNDGDEVALNFANNVFNIVIILSIILSVLSFAFAEPLVKLFAMKFEGEKLRLAIEFTKIMIFGMVFIGLTNVTKSWLNIKGNFKTPGMSILPYNIVIIISIIFSIGRDEKILAIGTLLAMISQFVFQYPASKKSGFKYKFYINIKDKYIKKMIILIFPVFIGVGVNQLNTVIDRSLASTLGDGIITVLSSANRLNIFIQAIFIATIVSVIYPTLSKLAIKENKEEFYDGIRKSMNTVTILIIPISVGAIILAEPVVRVVFERGKFDSNATALTSSALIAYSIGMIGFALRDVLNKVFYSIKDTRSPMINGALSMLINIILNIILMKNLGHIGLALATSISSIICIILMFNSLKKKIPYFGQDKIVKTLFKTLLSAICMGIVTKLTQIFFTRTIGVGFIQDIVILGICTLVGFISYTLVLLILKVDELSIIFDIINKKMKLLKKENINAE